LTGLRRRFDRPAFRGRREVRETLRVVALAAILAPLIPTTTARADGSAHAGRPAVEAPPSPERDESADAPANLESPGSSRLRLRMRRLGGVAAGSLGLGAGLAIGAARRSPEDTAIFTATAGVASGVGVALLATLLALRTKRRWLERELAGDEAVDEERRVRRYRLITAGWLLFAVGAGTVGFAYVVPGAEESEGIARFLGMTLGGGLVGLVGLVAALRGHVIGTASSVAVTVGAGTIGVAGTF